MKKYPAIINILSNTCWAIMPGKLAAIMDFINMKVTGIEFDHEAAARRNTKFKNVSGKIAVISIYGTIAQKMDMLTEFSGGSSTENIMAVFDEAINDPGIGAIVLDVDSPGGSVYGVAELAEKIYRARGKKPITAVVNSLMASAAFWIASAADEIVITPGGEIGSVGIIAVHVDRSKETADAGLKVNFIYAGKYKKEGNSYEPLDEEAYSYHKSRVDEYYDMFVSALANHRGVTALKVRTNFGEGRVLGAKDAIERKMADRIGTLEGVLNDITRKSQTSPVNRAYLQSKTALLKRGKSHAACGDAS